MTMGTRVHFLCIWILLLANFARPCLASDDGVAELPCELQILSAQQVSQMVPELIRDYSKHITTEIYSTEPYAIKIQLLLRWHAKQIGKNITNFCEQSKGCTELQVMDLVIEESSRVFLSFRKLQGKSSLLATWALGLAITLYFGNTNPVLGFIINNEISRITNIKREPIDLSYLPEIRKNAFATANGESVSNNAKPEIEAWKDQTLQDKAAFTDAEFGKLTQQGLSNDLANQLQVLQNKYGMNATLLNLAKQGDVPAGFPRVVKDSEFARSWAFMFFFVRRYYANIKIDDQAILNFTEHHLTPFDTEILRLSRLDTGSIGYWIHHYEIRWARRQTPNNFYYDQQAAETFYNRLASRWFGLPGAKVYTARMP